MLSTRTYDEFIAQVGALCMKDFSPKDEARISTIGNLAAKRAYKETQWWERWLVASEPRTASRGRVNATEDSFYVFGAGTDAVSGLYVRNGTVNSKVAYTMFDTDGTTALYDIEWDNSSDWQILDADDAVLYDITDASTTPPLTGWEANTGEDPAPLLNALADIDTFMTISGTDVIRDSTSRPIRFYVDSSGANLRSNVDNDVVWVTYKKANTDIYGDGNSGTVSDIPSEWFNYMTLYSAYMYQSSQRQNNPNAAYTLALREVENSLQDELIRLEDQHITDNLAKNIYTHLSQNQSLI
jgi:hypothetical protein